MQEIKESLKSTNERCEQLESTLDSCIEMLREISKICSICVVCGEKDGHKKECELYNLIK